MNDRIRAQGNPSKAAPRPDPSIRDFEVALEERFREIAYLTLSLRQLEEQAEPQGEEREWLRQVALALLAIPRWWGLMPRSWRRRKVRLFLQQSGLFDGDSYLKRNPDVAVTGADPLRHYLQHGIKEDRDRSG